MKKNYLCGVTYSLIIFTFIFVLFGHIALFAQSQSITGTVRDGQGAPLPGVSVVVKTPPLVRLPMWTESFRSRLLRAMC